MATGDCVGKKYGRLTIIKEWRDISRKTIYCETICECGNKHISQKGHLKSGGVRSCGCLVVDTNRKLLNRLTHNMSYTNQYNVWKHLKQRCNDKNCKTYKNYGGRGISYDVKWETFEGFWEDMKEGYRKDLTIERINNNDSYYKENCCWTSNKEQQSNKSNNHFITINGETKTVSQWEEKMGFNRNMIYSRLKRGWDEEKAVLVPSCYRRRVNKRKEK